MSNRDKAGLVALVAAILGVTTALLFRSWVIDDAYITLRTIDNFVNGHGLRWNVNERVQAFTHPLWTFVLLVPYYFTREAYFTSLFVSLGISVLTICVISFRLSADRLATILALAVLTLSRAFIDFSASNLENPLSHLLIATFAVIYFAGSHHRRQGFGGPSELHAKADPPSEPRVTALAVVAGLLVLVRTDLAFLVAPALATRLWQERRRAVRAILVGGAPVVVWTTVAFIYYGFPVPNTAYAKLAHGIPASIEIVQGFMYLLESLVQDPMTMVGIATGILAGLFGPRKDNWPVVAGIVWYLAYVVGIGGDYMSGRFLSSPFLFSVILILSGTANVRGRRILLAALAGVGLLAFAARSLVPPADRVAFLNTHFSDNDPKWQRRRARNTFRHIIDQRGDHNVTSLFNVLKIWNYQFDHEWIQLGKHVSRRKEDVFVYGAVGLVGYYAGPRTHIVDAAALGDPLLSRLPATFPWFPGHYDRRMPAGYFETLDEGVNKLEDPKLRAYYDDMLLVIRGPIWSRERWRAIWRLNFGGAGHLLEDYGATDAGADEQPGSWSYARESGTELWERGLRLRMQTPCTARRFELVVSGPAKYWLRYYSGSDLVATQLLDVPDNERRSIFAKVAVAAGRTFDRVDLMQANGAHAESLFLLRFSN